jgi:predicted TIM-barrel fold metal-dependent hydrolase
VKLYTAEWNGVSKGYSLRDDFVGVYLDKCIELGIDIIHVHKGPTIHPLHLDAFDVRDVDHVATDFPSLTFVVDHCGMPRIDDFCWIAGQEPNVMGGLALIPSFIHARPKYFAQMLSDLLFFLGPDRLIFGSDYGITSPKWIVEKFMAYEFPDDISREAGTQLTLDVKRKILGLNAARLYGLAVPEECRIGASAASRTAGTVDGAA